MRTNILRSLALLLLLLAALELPAGTGSADTGLVIDNRTHAGTANDRLIIVAGGGLNPGNVIQRQTRGLSRVMYAIAKLRGFTDDRINFLSSLEPAGQGGVDSALTINALDEAISNWGKGDGTGNLFVFLVDHGERLSDGQVRFILNWPVVGQRTFLLGSQLDGMLDRAQSGSGAVQRVVGIFDFCFAGRFVDDCRLDNGGVNSGVQRALFASTTRDRLANFDSSFDDLDLLSFSAHYLSAIYQLRSIDEAFNSATAAVRKYDTPFGAAQSPIFYYSDPSDSLTRNMLFGTGNPVGQLPPEITDLEFVRAKDASGQTTVRVNGGAADNVTLHAYKQQTYVDDPVQAGLRVPLEDKGDGNFEAAADLSEFFDGQSYVVVQGSVRSADGGNIPILGEPIRSALPEGNTPTPSPSPSPSESPTPSPSASPSPSFTATPSPTPNVAPLLARLFGNLTESGDQNADSVLDAGDLRRIIAPSTALAESSPFEVWKAGTQPSVVNLSAAQRNDGSKRVDIRFGLSNGNTPMTVSVIASNNNGASYTILPRPQSLSGNVGAGVPNGSGYVITWDAAADFPGVYWPQARIRVIAEDVDPTPTPSPSFTPSPSLTTSPSISPSATASVTASATASPSDSPTTATASPTASASPSATPSDTPSATASATASPSTSPTTATATASPSISPTPSLSPSATTTPTASASPSGTASVTPSPLPEPLGSFLLNVIDTSFPAWRANPSTPDYAGCIRECTKTTGVATVSFLDASDQVLAHIGNEIPRGAAKVKLTSTASIARCHHQGSDCGQYGMYGNRTYEITLKDLDGNQLDFIAVSRNNYRDMGDSNGYYDCARAMNVPYGEIDESYVLPLLPTPSPTATASATPSATATPSASPTTASPTTSASPSATASDTPSVTPTASLSPSATASATATASASPTTASPTASASATPTATPSDTPSLTPTASLSPSATPSATASPSASPTTASPTPSASPSTTATPTVTPASPTATPSATTSLTASATASPAQGPILLTIASDVATSVHQSATQTLTFTFEDVVGGFDASDVTVSGATKGAFSALSLSQFTLVITSTGGRITVDVPPNAATESISSYDGVAGASFTNFYQDTWTLNLPGNVPLELIRIPAGTFVMGSPEGELSRGSDETPHQVTLTQDFYLGKTEVTQVQWLALQSFPRGQSYGGATKPVHNVTWANIQSWLGVLDAQTRGLGTFALPSESQWEYACRAGSTTRFSFGNGFGVNESCSAEFERTNNMWYCGNNSANGPKSVGQKPASVWGLRDMHGNVWEWCADWYGNYPAGPIANPVGPDSGPARVFRGGGWNQGAASSRSAGRGYYELASWFDNVGFRVAATRPVPLTITSNITAPVHQSGSQTLTFTFAEAVSGFDASDIAVTGASKGAFSALSSTQYTLAITGTGGRINVDVASDAALENTPTYVGVAAATFTNFYQDTWTLNLPGNVPMELIRIPAGAFVMGSPEGELSRRSDETQHQVTLTQDFYLGKTEVTQNQWVALQSFPVAQSIVGGTMPVHNVSHDDIGSWMTALNTHITEPGAFSLPTESQWEYACRAETTTRFNFGNGFGSDEACSAEGERTNNMWYCGNNSPSGTKAVGQKPANAWGLRDMHGNVVEWCADWYGTYPGTVTNPTGPGTGSLRVLRGGGYGDGTPGCRSANRGNTGPSIRSPDFGFRVLAVR